MKKRRIKNIKLSTLLISVILIFTGNSNVLAHCDTMDGPVVIEATDALEKGDITPVLKWVKKEHENEIKTVFNHVLAVRDKGPGVKKIADRYFLETLIRLHREGEGASFTGLKPAGTIAPCILKADKALEEGSVDRLAVNVGNEIEKAIKERFRRVTGAKAHKDESVEGGREYVEAYVIYVHFLEGIHNLVSGGSAHGDNTGKKEHESHQH